MSPLPHPLIPRHAIGRATIALAAGVFATVLMAAAAAPVFAQSEPFCSTFDSGLDGFGPCPTAPNVTVQRIIDAFGLSPNNPYMRLTDLPNASAVCSQDPHYTGNWLEKMSGCGQLCYDFRVFNSGSPPTAITPSISLFGGGGHATYYAGFQVPVGDETWHHICAPIADGASPPAGIAGGYWTVVGASWQQIITNVTWVQLPIDFTRQPSEVVGYDNICITPGGCGKEPPPPEIKGCLEDMKVVVACKGGGIYTVTLSGGSFTGDTITLAAQTPGVTISPPQQPWAPTMTFTLSGGSPWQAVSLLASATRTGAGKAPDSDACCSGEIRITLPDCPEDKPVDVSIHKAGSTTPAQQPYYSFTLTITNNGAAFTGAGNITVTDTLPPGMTFNTVAAAPPGDWSCPASVPAGGTLTCTYTGSGPVGTGVIGTLTISATAGGAPPYPPVENCASVAVAGGYTDTDPDNNRSCVTVRKTGETGELKVTKEVEYLGPLVMPDLIYPISVQCGSASQVFNLHNAQTGSLGNIPLNSVCQITEAPPTSVGSACPPGSTPTWTTTYTPPAPVTVTAPVTSVTVHNTLACTHKGAPGTLQVVKTVENNTEADLTGVTFAATATCGGTATPLSLTTASPQTVANLVAGTVCTVAETLPPPPATGCTSGLYPAWEPATLSPATATIAAGATATITVANTLRCERGGYIAVTKTVVNNTQADLSGTSFPMTLACGSGDSASQRNLTLTAGDTALIHNVVVGTTCTPSETLPPAPASGCPAGSAPAWGTPVYTPATVTSVAGAGPTLAVRNTLDCVAATGGRSPAGPPHVPPGARKIACRAPLVPNAKGDACVCRPGTVRRGNRCVEPVTCVEPAFRNAQGTACLCPRDMVKRGNTCVRHQPEGPRGGPGPIIHGVPGLVPGFGGGHRGTPGNGRHQDGGHDGERKGSNPKSPGVN